MPASDEVVALATTSSDATAVCGVNAGSALLAEHPPVAERIAEHRGPAVVAVLRAAGRPA